MIAGEFKNLLLSYFCLHRKQVNEIKAMSYDKNIGVPNELHWAFYEPHKLNQDIRRDVSTGDIYLWGELSRMQLAIPLSSRQHVPRLYNMPE